MKIKKILLILFALMMLTACIQDPPLPNPNNPDDNNPDNPAIVTNKLDLGKYGDYVKYIDDEKDPSTLEEDYEKLQEVITKEINELFVSNYSVAITEFFNIDNELEIIIDIDEDELKTINEYHKKNNKESYRICNLDIKFKGFLFHYEQVGIRLKGNTSRGLVLDDNNNINLRHYKLSFQETFDDEYRDDPMTWTDEEAKAYREDRSFFELEKFDIRWNRNNDATRLKEYYAFEMYRNNNVLAPHSNLTNLKMNVNGKLSNLGVYLIVEDVNKDFIKRNMVKSATGGDLYKLGWTNVGASFDNLDSNLFGVEDQVKKGDYFEQIGYPYDLKSNKKTSDHSAIKNFISGIINTPVNQFDSFLKENTVYDSVISYLAISYLIGDPDDLRGNFNNGYIYFTKDTNKALFIPTDNDRAFASTGGSNPTGHYNTQTKPFDSTTGYYQNNNAPLFVKTVQEQANKIIKIDYYNRVKELANSDWMKIDHFKSYFFKAQNKYNDNVNLSKNVNGLTHSFSLVENNNIYANDNLSIEVYLNEKVKTFKQYVFNPDVEILENSNYYFRSTLNNWDGINNQYNLKIVDNVPQITIYLSTNDEFKIGTSDWSNSFGYEDIVNKEGFKSNGSHANISVEESGTYLIKLINYGTDAEGLEIIKIN